VGRAKGGGKVPLDLAPVISLTPHGEYLIYILKRIGLTSQTFPGARIRALKAKRGNLTKEKETRTEKVKMSRDILCLN